MRISVTLWKSEEKGIIIPGVGASLLVERIERRKTERSERDQENGFFRPSASKTDFELGSGWPRNKKG